MKILSAPKRLLTLLFLSLLAFTTTAISAHAAPTHLVIAEVYGGGSNTGAAYANDYVMLYNPTAAAISLSGYSLQYASSAGTSWTSETLQADTVQPGHYYLIALYSNSQQGGTNVGAALPTPDFAPTSATYLSSGTVKTQNYAVNMSAQYGKVLLSNSATITPAGTSCPVGTATTVDFLGFGAANCYEGSGPAANAGYTNSTSVSRKNPAIDTDDNALDFQQLATATPHNSTYTVAGLSLVSASAAPSSVNAGSATTLSVTVSPGALSTGVAVRADLSSIGGSSTQAFALSSTANVYTYTENVPGATAANSYSLPVTVTDQESGSATGSIALTVTTPVTLTPIATLQANRSTYVGTTISTSGVVTSVVYNGFFLQMPGTPASRTSGIPEGIDVFTSSAPTVHVGDNVTVTGALTLFPLASASVTPALEVSKPTITTNSTGNPLPTPIVLTTADLTATGGFQQLTRYESMRVQMSLTATSGTGASGLSGATEVNETYTSNGYFYAVMTGTARPFREPGVDVRDAGASALPSTIQRFDDNPERIYVATTLMNAAPIDVSTGAQFANVTGILDFTYSNDSFYDPSRFIPDAGVMLANYTAGIQPVAAALPTAGQATVAAFNIERFFNTSAADDVDNYPASSSAVGGVYHEPSEAVDITQAAYTRRLTKVSLAIRHMLNNPDIIAFEESENVFVLRDIAAQISSDAATAGETDPKYVAYGVDDSTFYTNDEGGISVGFLAKSTVDVTGFDQFFNTTTFTPTGGNLTTVNDRPPMVLHAGIKRGTGVKDYPVTVIVNHLKALPDSTTAVQQKKELQVEELASLFQGYQANGEHVLAVGDFNAFEFNDGYGDYLGTATNKVVAAPATTVTPGKSGLVTPAATDLALNMPANLRYSYVEDGSAQILDHVIASADIASSTQLAYVHFDADFPNTAYNDATTPARTSDHDPALAYLTVPAPVAAATTTGTAAFPTTIVAVSSAGQVFTLTNTGEAPITFTGAVATGDFSASTNCTSPIAVGASCAINVVFKPTAAGPRTGTLTVTTSAAVNTVSLTGTAVLPADFSIADSTTAASSTTITVPAGTSSTGTLKLTSLNGFAGAVALTCNAPSSGAVTGATCTVTSPVTLAAAGTATATITITTMSRATVSTSGFGTLPGSGMVRVMFAMLMVLMAGGLFAVRRAGGNIRVGGLLALLFVLALGLGGCSSHSSLNITPNSSGTPAGTYAYTVTATSGSLTHTQTINVVVQ